MKSIRLPKQLEPFLTVAENAETEMLVFTEKKRPVAALVSLRNVDRESLALGTNPQFLGIIEKARKEIRAGKTASLESVERKFGLDAHKKRRKRAVESRNRH